LDLAVFFFFYCAISFMPLAAELFAMLAVDKIIIAGFSNVSPSMPTRS